MVRTLIALILSVTTLIACATTQVITETTIVRTPPDNSSMSWAQDRLDQRYLPLDNVYRQPNSGKGVTIYVFDGGISAEHPELMGRVRLGFPKNKKTIICGDHGTEVAGAAAGTMLGVALSAEVVDVRIFQCGSDFETEENIKDAVNWVIDDYYTRKRPAVANWSFGHDSINTFGDKLVQRLVDAGITVVTAAGNKNVDACGISPGRAPNALNVGSSNIRVDSIRNGKHFFSDVRSDSTAFGRCVTVYAPGTSVLTASIDAAGNTQYSRSTGTSMSTAIVSGVVALYLETHPNATPHEVINHIQCTATKNIVRDAGKEPNYMIYVGDINSRCGLTGKSPASEAGHHADSNSAISTVIRFWRTIYGF